MRGGLFWLLMCVMIFSSMLGGRFGWYFLTGPARLSGAEDIARVLKPGRVYWAGLLSGVSGIWIFIELQNRRFLYRDPLAVLDYIATGVPLGHMLGRLGCLAAGCCYGRPCRMPWGIRFVNLWSSVPLQFLGIPLHPVQLYEAMGEVLIFLFLAFAIIPRIRAGRIRRGMAFWGYILLYSCLRFCTEFFRWDPRGTFLSPVLSPAQWFSLFSGSAAVVFILWMSGGKAAVSRGGGGPSPCDSQSPWF